MLAETLETLVIRKGSIPPGRQVNLPDSIAMHLIARGKIRPVSPARLESGELKLVYPVDNLAAVIVGLTKNDLELQKVLLLKHCQQYDPNTHFWALREKWEERSAILEYDSGMARDKAEQTAAQMYYLEAFLPELRAEKI